MKMLIVSALVCAMMVLTRAAAPSEETPQDETAPSEETPQDETAPSEETPQDETERRLVKRWFLSDFIKKIILAKKLFIQKLLGQKKFPVPVKWCVGRGACPSGWLECKGHCYRYVPTRMTWTRAEKHCQSLGGNFASVHSIQEYQAIQDVIYRATHSNKEAWIGGCDVGKEHHWYWSDATSFNYRRWCHGEPNNHGGREHCLQINFSGHNCWNDLRCSDKLPSVCSKERW